MLAWSGGRHMGNRTLGVAKRAPRIDIRKPAMVIDSDGAAIEVVILDLSGSGFRLQLTGSLRIGEFVTLRVDRGDVPAQIRWTMGDEAGGAFLASVDHGALGERSGSADMADDEEMNAAERRDGDERRKGDRRQGEERRQGGRSDDRRAGDRREGDRRE
jgi:hypothetical protein